MLCFIALLAAACAISTAATDRDLRTVVKFANQEIDIKSISSALPRSSLPDFVHGHELLAALADKRRDFTVSENVKREDLPSAAKLSYDELSSLAIHTTKSDYVIGEHADFINLDDSRHVGVLSISDEHVEHCSEEYTAPRTLVSADPGRAVYVIGTSKGAWHKAEHVSAWVASKAPSSSSTSSSFHHPTTVNKGLYVLREVAATTRGSSDRCLVLQTKPVHHLELFSSVEVRSEGTRPYSTTYGLKDDMEAKLNKDREEYMKNVQPTQAAQAGLRGGRELTTTWNQVDTEYGFAECKYAAQTSSDPNFPGPWSIHSTTTAEAQYMLGLTLGCIQYTKSIANFNFNYDTDAKKAITDPLTVSGVTGVSCKNCHAYLGGEQQCLFIIFCAFFPLFTRSFPLPLLQPAS